MQFLIIGNGILGSAICRYIAKNDTTTTVRSFTRKHIDLVNSYQSIEKALHIFDFHSTNTWVINAAAYTDVDGAERDKQLCFETNVKGAYRLATACKHLQAKLVHISTDFVFNGLRSPHTEVSPACHLPEITGDVAYTEYDTDCIGPVNWYGHAKQLSEEVVKNSGCEHIIIRTGWLYDNERGIIPSFIRKAKNNKETFLSVTDQHITPTYAEDLADQILGLCANDVRGLFHATSQGSVRPCDLFKLIHKKINGTDSDENPIGLYNAYMNRAPRPAMCVLRNLNLEMLQLDRMPHWMYSVNKLLEKYNDR